MKGLYIPNGILNLEGVNAEEKIILAMVNLFEVRGDGFFMGNKNIARIISRSPRTTSAKINRLIKLGHLKFLRQDGRRRYLRLARELKDAQSSIQPGKLEHSRIEKAANKYKKGNKNLNHLY